MNHSSKRSNSAERPCGLTALLPLGMSCRGRAEAFARSLQSRLRTLGSQTNETTPITSETSTTENSWLNQNTHTQPSIVTNHQPLSARNGLQDVADAYFDFDIPQSPVDDGEYTRLIDSTDTFAITPQENAPESGYVCASPISTVENSIAIEQSDSSSTDEPFFDPDGSDSEQRSISLKSNEQRSLSLDYYDCDEFKKGTTNTTNTVADKSIADRQNQSNGFDSNSNSNNNSNSSSSTESLPKSQSTTISTFTANTSESNNTLGNELDMPDFYTAPAPAQPPPPPSSSQPPTSVENVDSIKSHDACNEINCNKDETILQNHNDSNVDTNTNSISTNECNIRDVANDVQEIPKYDATTEKSQLTVENFVNGHSSDNEIDDEQIPRSERFRRSSSLKTGKTPPGTPGRKKIVRFADVLGLDLADVRTFLDEIPRIPKSVFDELQLNEPEPPISLGQRLDKIIVPLFQQPGLLANFLNVVERQNVLLESAIVTDPICLTISGLVCVRNLDFHKSVHIRYSLDNWLSYSDLQAEYVPNSCDGFMDKFSFTLFGNSMDIGQRIEIAIRFSCKGEQFWDNNHGINYCFQCMPATTPQLQSTINNANTQNDNNRHDVHHDLWCGSSFY